MSELLTTLAERKLWYEGPNYAADAVVIDQETLHILLIQRADTGEWALPGGFIDPSDSSSMCAAAREVCEEAGITLPDNDAPLIFRGRVDDPRSSESAWIETSAHLFNASSDVQLEAGDDASNAAWHDLYALPPLYGSHREIIARALDYIHAEDVRALIETPESSTPVEGGFMRYNKSIVTKYGRTAFLKQRPDSLPIPTERFEDMRRYLEKEAGVMAHLRIHGYKHIPKVSAFTDNTLVMDAYSPTDGWRWDKDDRFSQQYMDDILTALKELERMPLPRDSFDVEPSYESLVGEGWPQFNAATETALTQKYAGFLAELPDYTQTVAAQLLEDIPLLREVAATAPEPDTFVFCHHDLRPSNFAWHPLHGAKIIDWSWAGPGLPGTDSTSLLIDLHKNGFDVRPYNDFINPQHCLTMLGFWLRRSTLPNQGAEGLREQQFLSALSAYDLLRTATTPRNID